MLRISASLITALVCVALFAGAAAAQQTSRDESAPSDQPQAVSELDRLFTALKRAQSAGEAQVIASQIWQRWTEGPDEQAGETIKQIMAARGVRDLEKALSLCNRLTKRLPGYAEGWNQKATVLFEIGRLDRSLETVEKVLELEPRHFGALAGKGLILLRQGRVKLAQKAIRRAVEIHPYLPERRFLAKPPGERI
jgi:tetratricopeptide (TPR) repeat protein